MNQAKTVLRASFVTSLAALFVMGMAGAAQAAAPVPAEAPAPKAPAATAGAPAAAAAAVAAAAAPTGKDIWGQTPYPLYEQRDRVDPFTRGKPKTIVDPGKPRPAGDPVGKAIRAYDDAEALLSSERKERYALCQDACHKGIQDLRQTIADSSKNDALARDLEPARALMERFQRLEATAKRLKQRQDIEADFANLKITVDGIVWTEQSPSAAISGQVASEGTVIKAGTGGQAVQVHRIRRDAVVFLYKGVQISVRLDRGGL